MTKIKGIVEDVSYVQEAKCILVLIGHEQGRFRAQIPLDTFLEGLNATMGNRSEEEIKREIDKLLEICEYRKKYIYKGKEIEFISDPKK